MDRTVGLLLVYATIGAFPQITSAQGRGSAERDSAGVRIITERPRAPVSLVNARPLFTVDGSEHGRDPFFRNLYVVALQDGFVVANSGTSDLRFYGADGTPRSAAGRRGGGPGEFQMISWMQRLANDSIGVYDGRLRRVSVWSLRGDHVRDGQVSIPRATPTPGSLGAMPATVIGALPDGHLLMASGVAITPGAGVQRAVATLIRANSSGEQGDTLRRVYVIDYQTSVGGGGPGTRPLMFPRMLTPTVGSEGFAISEGADFRIDRFSGDGRHVTSIRVNRPARSVTATDRDAALAKQPRESPPDVVFPATFPAYSALWFDREGRLWAEVFQTPTATAGTWDVFDHNGRLLATIQAPTSLRLVAADAARIYAIHTDELDVQTIRAFAAPAALR